MNKDMLEIYSDYLLSSFSQTTATGLSSMTDGQISHDQVTRFLSSEDFTSRDLWKLVKKSVRSIESEEGVLIIDDTIQEKPYTDENDLISWHYDHTKGRSVKGINMLNCVYHSQNRNIPVAFELIKKTIKYSEIKTRKLKRESEKTKNELAREILRTCKQQSLSFGTVLFDIWFSSSENINFIVKTLKKRVVCAMKTNRLAALSHGDKLKGCFVRIDEITALNNGPVKVWLKGLDFEVLLHKQIFKNKDGSTGTLYLICSDLSSDKNDIEKTYQKRWGVEVFHKQIKSNANLAKSPTRKVRTQSNHIFLSVYAAFKLEKLSVKKKLNQFALKTKLLISATKSAYQNLLAMKTEAIKV